MLRSDEDAYGKRILSGFENNPKRVLWIYQEAADCKRCGRCFEERRWRADSYRPGGSGRIGKLLSKDFLQNRTVMESIKWKRI